MENDLRFIIDCNGVSRNRYMRHVWRRVASRWWPAVVVPIAVCAVLAAVFDSRWLVAGLILAFMAVPSVMLIIFYNNALTPLAQWSMLDKRVTIDSRGMTLHFSHPKMRDHSIAWDEITRIMVAPDEWLVYTTQSRYAYFLLPRDAFNGDETGDLEQRVRRFAQRIMSHPAA